MRSHVGQQRSLVRRRIVAMWHALPAPLRAPFVVVTRAVLAYSHDDCSVYAASISYYALFSLVPLSLVTLAGFGYFVDRDTFVDFIFNQLPIEETPRERERLEDLLQQLRDLSGTSALIALPVLLWTGTGLFSAVRRGLNATDHNRTRRSIWRAKLLDFAMIPSLGVLVIVSVATTASAQVVLERVEQLGLMGVDVKEAFEVASIVLAGLVSFVMFTLVYRYVPGAHPRWREAMISAVVATLLFEGLKLVGAILLRNTNFAADTGIYAGVGAVFAFLFWVYLNASILLFGAEIGQAIFEPTEPTAAVEEHPERRRLRRIFSSLRPRGINDA